MKRVKLSPLMVLVALLVMLAAWALYHSIEFYEETSTTSWSFEALTNPYLAAQQFMGRSGTGVTDVDSLVKLDQLDGIGTLFFTDANQVRSPRQLQMHLLLLNRILLACSQPSVLISPCSRMLCAAFPRLCCWMEENLLPCLSMFVSCSCFND